jgi:D-3-phosphoglycerate dehydrogenase
MKPLKGKKVLIGPSSFSDLDKSPLEYLIETGCEVIDNPFKRKLTKAELMDLLKAGATGLIAGLEPLDREVMENSVLKVISRCGAGMSNVDLEAAKALGIEVRFTPDAPTTAVAELTVGAMLALLRMIPLMDHELHRGRWTKKVGTQLEGKTVVIIGYGRIGRKVASLLIPFKINILVVDPFLQEVIPGVSILPSEEALPEANIITLHSSGENCVLGQKEFELITPGAFVLNAARGGLIDEDALITALDDGTIQGAWLDTFGQEPYDGRLTEYPQVILTPHVGSYTRECRKQMEMESVQNLIQALKE